MRTQPIYISLEFFDLAGLLLRYEMYPTYYIFAMTEYHGLVVNDVCTLADTHVQPPVVLEAVARLSLGRVRRLGCAAPL